MSNEKFKILTKYGKTPELNLMPFFRELIALKQHNGFEKSGRFDEAIAGGLINLNLYLSRQSPNMDRPQLYEVKMFLYPVEMDIKLSDLLPPSVTE